MNLNEFLEHHSTERMSTSLLDVFFDYLRNQHEGMPLNLDIVLDDIQAIFELLLILRKQ